jgi:hypothetical protein
MLIGVVGGLDRDAPRLMSIARAAGHDVEVHTGTLSTTRVEGLRSLVARADLVLVLTDINSHGAVQMARRLARAHHRPLHLMRRFGTSQFAAFLRQAPEQLRAAA